MAVTRESNIPPLKLDGQEASACGRGMNREELSEAAVWIDDVDAMV